MRGGGATCTGGWWPSALVGGGCTVQNGGNFWASALFAGAVGELVLRVGLRKDAQGCCEYVYTMLEAGVQLCRTRGHYAGCTPRRYEGGRRAGGGWRVCLFWEKYAE